MRRSIRIAVALNALTLHVFFADALSIVAKIDGHVSTAAAPLMADIGEFWCGIEIDGKEVPVQYGEFTRLRDGGVFEAKIEKKKAKLDFGRSPAIVAGEYKCEVRSIEGSIAEGSMVIYSAPFLRLPTGSKFYEIPSASPPKVIGGVKRVHEGARVELRCPVFGYPEPYTRWEKDDEPVEMSISVEYNGNDLILKDVDESMSGIYSCIADNSFQIYEDGPTIPHQLIYNQKLIVQFSNSLSSMESK